MNPFEVERLGWEEIRGVPIRADDKVGTGRFEILCAGDGDEPELEESVEKLATVRGELAEAQLELAQVYLLLFRAVQRLWRKSPRLVGSPPARCIWGTSAMIKVKLRDGLRGRPISGLGERPPVEIPFSYH